ncbi:hypothetical protein SBOR_8776 [Sclerotinia borealis F-4128]|uniref:Complex III subunit 9 n=1 Tax=Sclerotinia borealis (strain F-4128) TaxID=1432307 RepID=W9C4P7_SCLBF|nr:hypothetical protein SBOR_8776 [Sclerotinia borealis F-4128]
MPAASRPLYKSVTLPTSMRPLQRDNYGFLFRKNFVFLGAVFGAAFAFEMGYDSITDRVWDTINKGRQWKDIRSKYVEAAEED